MRALVLSVLAAVALAPAMSAQQAVCSGASVRITQDSLAFALDSIPGWSVDCYAGRADTVLAMFYRNPVRRGMAFMYANLLTPDSARVEPVETAIARDVAQRRRWTPDLAVTARRSLRTKTGEVVAIRDFVSASKNRFERVAYVPLGSAIAILGVRAPDQATLDSVVRDFERLVQAYTPIVAARPF